MQIQEMDINTAAKYIGRTYAELSEQERSILAEYWAEDYSTAPFDGMGILDIIDTPLLISGSIGADGTPHFGNGKFFVTENFLNEAYGYDWAKADIDERYVI